MNFSDIFKTSNIFFALLCSWSVDTYAQMVPMQYKIPTPYGNISHTYYVYQPRYYSMQGAVSPYCNFTIILKNDSTIQNYLQINIADTLHYFKIKRGRVKSKIYPTDTKSIYCTDEEGKRMDGIPADSCWLFKSGAGKINTYTFIPEYNSSYIVAIQKGDGPIVPITQGNLKPMLEDNAEALKCLSKKKLLKAIKIYNKK